MEARGEKYKYLFPYELVPRGREILIYGAGTLGQEYLRQMVITNYCNVVGMVDRKWKDYPPMIVPVYAPEDIPRLKFDYVVIALRIAIGIDEIMRILKKQGVCRNKIICIFERKAGYVPLFRENGILDDQTAMAYQKSDVSFAVLLSGGIGDMVIQKKYMTELIENVPDCKIDLYTIKTVEFLEYLYSDCGNINRVIPDLGSRYHQNCKNYALAMTIEACHFISVDYYKENVFAQRYPMFSRKIHILQAEIKKENIDIAIPVHVTLIRRLYKGCNAYTGFNYNGAFMRENKNVNIPLVPSGKEYFDSLELGRYITVNYGNGECRDRGKVAKAWPLEYFGQVVKKFKEKFPTIEVVQLGEDNAAGIKGVDRSVLGENFGRVAYILKNAIFHLDIEGGLVHIASQLGTKCIVLFGPTVQAYYAYEGNINISAGRCHNCWGIYSNINKCARGLKEPECMYSITPDMVMESIYKYMDYKVG